VSNNRPRKGASSRRSPPRRRIVVEVSPGWETFIRYCESLGYGVIAEVSVQDGVPVSAIEVEKKIRF